VGLMSVNGGSWTKQRWAWRLVGVIVGELGGGGSGQVFGMMDGSDRGSAWRVVCLMLAIRAGRVVGWRRGGRGQQRYVSLSLLKTRCLCPAWSCKRPGFICGRRLNWPKPIERHMLMCALNTGCHLEDSLMQKRHVLDTTCAVLV
jgi:hypothetical protein